ncbi:MAG TPA: peptide-methionine (R)-S-oxide reductase MsrB [Kofleriaceae bacterium]|nr:peptide-methionine (R)-S-oxide reductase MsrB [Kofleriaceae bacterium]
MSKRSMSPAAVAALATAAAVVALAFGLVASCGGKPEDPEAVVDTTPRPIRTAKPSDAELRKELTRVQYRVTQLSETEPPFHNAYHDNHAAGLYVDVTTGQPLFTSNEKFDSGTGWPSFYQPISPDAVVEHHDRSLGMDRVEVRSKIGDAHLGHVFDDGPRPTGLRYCINSASLRFIPVDQLEAQGYGAYRSRFASR